MSYLLLSTKFARLRGTLKLPIVVGVVGLGTGRVALDDVLTLVHVQDLHRAAAATTTAMAAGTARQNHEDRSHPSNETPTPTTTTPPQEIAGAGHRLLRTLLPFLYFIPGHTREKQNGPNSRAARTQQSMPLRDCANHVQVPSPGSR